MVNKLASEIRSMQLALTHVQKDTLTYKIYNDILDELYTEYHALTGCYFNVPCGNRQREKAGV